MGRRKFSPVFKSEAVRLAMQPGEAVSSIAQDLGLHDSVLRRWVKYASAPAVLAPLAQSLLTWQKR